MQIACPHCLAKNRVPDDRAGRRSELRELSPAAAAGRAGRACGARTCAAFAAGTALPVVADFWADWCGPCKTMAPAFADAARRRPLVQFVKVDTEASPRAAQDYAIRGIPTLILFEGGREKARVSGAMQAQQLLAWLDQHARA